MTPEWAISIRQFWAWAVIHGGKDVENRSLPRRFKAAVGQRVLIHAGLRMTSDEYSVAVAFMAGLGVRCPAPEQLARGGVIGSVAVVDIVARYPSSRWWNKGAHALVLADPQSLPFRPARGQVGLFRVQP